MIPSPPEVTALVLDVPDSCRMRGEFVDLPHLDDELTIRVVLGNSGDRVQLRFARAALKRFLGLAADLLLIAHHDDDPEYEPPILTAEPV